MSESRRAGSGCHLSGLCTVQFLDEVVERVGLPKENEVAAEAVSLHCRAEEIKEKSKEICSDQ